VEEDEEGLNESNLEVRDSVKFRGTTDNRGNQILHIIRDSVESSQWDFP